MDSNSEHNKRVPHFAETLKEREEALATIRHPEDGAKNRVNVKIMVVGCDHVTQEVLATEGIEPSGDLFPFLRIPFNDVYQEPRPTPIFANQFVGQEDQDAEAARCGDYVAGESWIALQSPPSKGELPHDGQDVEILTSDRGVITGMEFDQSDADYWTFSKYETEGNDDSLIEYYIGDNKVTHWRPAQPFTYRRLLEQLKTATDEQLDSEVILWWPDGGTKIDSIAGLEADYINPEGEGLVSVEDFDADDPDMWEQPNMNVVLKKGTLVMWAEDGPFYTKL